MGPEGGIIAERYALERKLGEGAMGAVWLARHLTLGTPVAIKLIRREALERNKNALTRFEREAVTAARIRSTHVVKVIDHGYHDGLPFMVMEYLEGESLRTRLGQRHRLPLPDAALVVRHIARALTQAHALGLVHRDIKPENVFITPGEDEQQEVVKVLDFGIAKVTDELMGTDKHTTKTGAFLGTPHYMSPEQAYGLKTVGPRSDLWSLGVVAFECVVGQRPFRAPALGALIAQVTKGPVPVPSEVAPELGLPPAIDAWMARALSRDVNVRFDNAREMAEAFSVAAGVGFTMSSMASSGAHPSAMSAPSQVVAPEPAAPYVPAAEVAYAPQVPAQRVPAQPYPAAPYLAAPQPMHATMPYPHGAQTTQPYPEHQRPAPTIALPSTAHGPYAPVGSPAAYTPEQPIETAEPVSRTVGPSYREPAPSVPKASLALPAVLAGAVVLGLAGGVGVWIARTISSQETSAAPAEPAATEAPAAEPSEERAEPPPAPSSAAPAASSAPPSDPSPSKAKPDPKTDPKTEPKSTPSGPEPWKHRRTL